MEKKQVFKNAVAISAVLTVSLGLSGCYSSAEKVVKLIDLSKYDEALSYFHEQEMEQSDREELIVLLSQKLTETVSMYAKNEIEYDSALKVVETISQFQLEELVAEASIADVKLQNLLHSKTMYEDGKRAFDNDDFHSALSCLQYVIPDDVYYESALELYSKTETLYAESVINQCEELCKAKDYTTALDVLYTAEVLLPKNELIQSQINKTRKEYNQYKFEVAKDELTKSVDKLINKGDYEEALVMIESFIYNYNTEDEDITGLYSKCKEGYEALIIEKVNALRDEKKYLKAIEIITNAQKIVDSEKFSSLLDALEAEKPIYLCDVKCQNSNRFELITSGTPPMDTIGNEYELSNLFIISAEHESWSSPDCGYADYYLGYKYNTFSGSIAVEDTSDNASFTLQIEGDGEVLYSIYLDRLTAPVDFKIDVSNVNVLTIRIADLNNEDTAVYVILSNHLFEK